ncbi:WYL domain-containing protein [Limosilactobacillus sp. STM2_1]|uniref:WYL domain-containing protein n=1 Tax=Limosilactobacillus rudii TaxID=2759755 RepID=A0A7W3UKL3_9LACO|nr:WYL domain-containing protein [Limosilactobacillus rudii]MBB1079242.1 WYL domain-containing protein [Limosilactobacillus rudii]MBB1097331.1 WYL domain-containing protein [Limosilactobacillus rudii]MCD7134440.1 WYL domain-containing protein [Limosilactobacillus rudii]
MKKSERLVQEISYLDNHHHFNLKDLIHEFGISKRTALRDLQALEETGLAIYSEPGKYGGYNLINKEPLIPINFTSGEISAIFFAISALRLLNDNPFQQSYPRIADRLLESLSNRQRDRVRQIQQVVEYYRVPSVHHNNRLHQLLRAILNTKLVKIKSHQDKRALSVAQLRRLLYRNGNWFIEGIDIHSHCFFRYRCDLLAYYEELSEEAPYTLDEIDSLIRQGQRVKKRVKFTCELTTAGCEYFLKNHYPDMKLNGNRLQGFYSANEYQYLLTYLLSYGKEIKVISPSQLKKDYIAKIKEILSQYGRDNIE